MAHETYSPKMLAPFKAKTVAEQTCDRLRQAVIEGVFEPGVWLKERVVAEYLGVSTTPIKEALRRLEAEGLVRVVPMRGSFVADDVDTMISEVGILRAAIEGAAAFLAAQKASIKDLERLSQQLNIMKEAVETQDRDAAVKANTLFHELIHVVSANQALNHMTDIVRTVDRVVRERALSKNDEMKRGFQEHKAIYDAIYARDPNLAEERMRSHIRRSMKTLM